MNKIKNFINLKTIINKWIKNTNKKNEKQLTIENWLNLYSNIKKN